MKMNDSQPPENASTAEFRIIGLSMAALPCCAEEDVEAGSAALRVDWPVYPRRAEHNTVAEKGNRGWAETQGNRLKIRVTNGRRAESVVIL
jgi:hypothetical protein